jgi:hypothetical protein
LSFYAWRLTGANGHLVAAVGFLVLGASWSRLPVVAWIGALLILGGSVVRWIG